MIEFVEKEPWYYEAPFIGNDWFYPTYMIKDGKEFFMFNRRNPPINSWDKESEEAYKKQLTLNGGRYFTFYGYLSNPFDMLKTMAERHHHLESLKLFDDQIEDERWRYFDFGGNSREVSSAFKYRIYDTDMIEKIKATVSFLQAEQWSAVIAYCERFS